MSQAADQGAQKLAVVFKPMLDEIKKELKEHNVSTSQDVLVAIGRLETRIDILEKLVSEKRKPTATRGEKKTAGVAEGAAATPAANDAPIAPPAGAQKNFAVNKLVYFREQFKTDANFRAKYVTPELQELMDKDPLITGKAKEDQKLVAQATFCWNYFKTNTKDGAADAIEKEYAAAKQAHEAANKPAQQQADPRTPPNEKA